MNSIRSIGRWVNCAIVLAIVCGNAETVSAETASFTGLGDFVGARFESAASGISPDGTVVVGYGYNRSGNQEAFRWTEETGLIGLGDLPGGGTFSDSSDVSAYGRVVVGDSLTEEALVAEGFVWSEQNGMIGVGDFPGGKLPDGWGEVWSRALDVSADGSIVVGVAYGELGAEAFRWTLEGGLQGLGDLPGGFFDSGANAVTADGLVIVGLGARDRTEAVRWTVEEGILGLGFMNEGDLWSVATEVAADGRVIIGLGANAEDDLEAFRWTEEGGMVGLGNLPGGRKESEANALSADGSVVVGSGYTEGGRRAFVWEEEFGMRLLQDVLAAEHGLASALEGWVLEVAYSISADGNRIVGWGLNPRGQKEAFLAVLAHADPARTSRLANLSVRTSLSAGQALIAGVVREGSAGPVLFRAAGPSLMALDPSVPGMEDPRLMLFSGSSVISENDDWPDSLAELSRNLGAFPFAAGSTDSALLSAVSGSQTLQVQGDGPGIALFEAYDAGDANSSRLINLSARNRVGKDGDVLIAGFVVGGTGTLRVLIRCVGPGLESFGVEDFLEDPILELYGEGVLPLLVNDDWEAEHSDEAALLGAFPLPRGSADAALLAELEAGEKVTVVMKGANGGEGEGLIEVYAID